MNKKHVLAAAALLALSGCSTLAESLGRCAFGGATPEEDAYCEAVNFGGAGPLHDADPPAGGESKAHVTGDGCAPEEPLPNEAVVSCPSLPTDVGYAVMSP